MGRFPVKPLTFPEVGHLNSHNLRAQIYCPHSRFFRLPFEPRSANLRIRDEPPIALSPHHLYAKCNFDKTKPFPKPDTSGQPAPTFQDVPRVDRRAVGLLA